MIKRYEAKGRSLRGSVIPICEDAGLVLLLVLS